MVCFPVCCPHFGKKKTAFCFKFVSFDAIESDSIVAVIIHIGLFSVFSGTSAKPVRQKFSVGYSGIT